ncbi:hypothetical protein CC79DRAFT_1341864 [Sarocladium strictum]
MGLKRTTAGGREAASLAKRSRPIRNPPIFDVDTGRDVSPNLEPEDYTIAWICALHLELAASLALLDEQHPPLPSHPGDDNNYVLGRIQHHNVVMVCLPGQYGTNNAAIVATNLKRSFPNIRATLMVGVGGGAPAEADLRLGDVVVGTRVMQYDMGKVVTDGSFLRTALPKLPAPFLNSAVCTLRSKHAEEDRTGYSNRVVTLLRSRFPSLALPSQADRLFQASYDHVEGAPNCDGCDQARLQSRSVRLSDEPMIQYGVIASGNELLRNSKRRDMISSELGAICFEMEAAGMMDNLQCLPIRGICDYSDSHKNKISQDYAAATAACYARELLELIPPIHGSVSKRRERLMESLDFSQIEARRSNVRAAHNKTCLWLLANDTYQDWLDPAKQLQNHGLLWMRGKAGAGKSTLMKFIYLDMKRKRKERNVVVASFFFNARGEYLEKSVIGMYRSLLLQLLRTFRDLQAVLDDTDIVPWNQQGCPDLNSLKELLRSAIMALEDRSLFLFIDALDECEEHEVRDMLHFFEDLAESASEEHINLRVFFSSRPYPHMSIRRGVSLTLELQAGHTEDLARYVRNHLRVSSPALLADLQALIIDKAAGIFMWIVLVVDILNKESSRGSLAIRKKLSDTPKELGQLFKSMLERDNIEPHKLRLCLLWILCAKRPLTPAEFHHALWISLVVDEGNLVDPELPDADDFDACEGLVTSSSKGLAEITNSATPNVQFIHESVRDFLVKERGFQAMWPDLGFEWQQPGHERIKKDCAAYLHHPLVQNAINECEARGSGSFQATENCPFLHYASQQVLYHADVAAELIPQDDFLTEFFTVDSIRLLNLSEKAKVRHYTAAAPLIYILADKGLANLLRMQTARESANSPTQERYRLPVFAALANGHVEAVAILLGVSPRSETWIDLIKDDVRSSRRSDLGGCEHLTPLSWAAMSGKVGIMECLFQRGARLDERDGEGFTPLHRAATTPFTSQKGVHFLIGKRADMEARVEGGKTALMIASQRGGHPVVRLLVAAGADINAKDDQGRTARDLASQWGEEFIVSMLERA